MDIFSLTLAAFIWEGAWTLPYAHFTLTPRVPAKNILIQIDIKPKTSWGNCKLIFKDGSGSNGERVEACGPYQVDYKGTLALKLPELSVPLDITFNRDGDFTDSACISVSVDSGTLKQCTDENQG